MVEEVVIIILCASAAETRFSVTAESKAMSEMSWEIAKVME